MTWAVEYLPEVYDDLKALGRAQARRILKVIEARIVHGEPDQSGKPLRKPLTGCRRIRVSDTRIVYRIHKEKVCVLIVAVGMRRDSEAYEKARERIS